MPNSSADRQQICKHIPPPPPLNCYKIGLMTKKRKLFLYKNRRSSLTSVFLGNIVLTYRFMIASTNI